MKTIPLAIILLALFSLNVSADTIAKVEQLMNAQGLVEIWQEQIEIEKIKDQEQADLILHEFMSYLSPSKEFTDRFNAVSGKFTEKLQNSWTAKEIVTIWAKYYTPHFTEKELDQLIAFYTSDIGQKEVHASKITVIKFTQHFQKENTTIMKNAINNYITDLKMLAKECNCRKQQ